MNFFKKLNKNNFKKLKTALFCCSNFIFKNFYLLNQALKIGDSLTLALGAWLGIPGLPTVTFYRQIRAKERKSGEATWEGALPRIAGLVPDQLQKCLVALPVWFALQVKLINIFRFHSTTQLILINL